MNRTPLRYLTPKGRAAEARHAREATPRILELLEDYFGMAYPFEKLDLLALPEADGRLAFPAFQFTRTGERLPGLERILKVFAGAVETPYTIASWFVTPESRLAGKRPAAWLRAGRPTEPVLEAATRYAERLRR